MRLRPAACAAGLCALLAGCVGAGHQEPSRGAQPGAGSLWPQPVVYQLDLAYEPRRFRLQGTQRIRFENTGPRLLRSVWLRTWANAFGSCRRRYVTVAVSGGGRAAGERVGCTALEVALDQPVPPGQRGEVALDVTITAPPRPDRTGRFGGGSYFGNAIPLLAVEDRTGAHLPPYTFSGESFHSLAASWEVSLALPRGQEAATTGHARATGEGIRVDVDGARDFTIVAGPFRVTSAFADGVRLRHFRRRSTPASVARRTLRSAARSLRAYNDWFGRYGSDELDLVEGPGRVAREGLAMEYPELVLTPANPFAVDHEVAHQWFWHLVGNDQYRSPWLDESLAQYATLRLLGRLPRLRSVANCRRQAHPEIPLSASMATFERRPGTYADVVYNRGACTWGTLERQWGARRLLRALRRYVAAHRLGVATQDDLIRALREAAPDGFRLGRFLRDAGIRPL